MSASLVEAFNALPQSQTIALERIPNEWHFVLCFTRRVPILSFHLLILQPYIKLSHTISLCGNTDPQDNSTAGFNYFPDTPQEAAPEIVEALLHFFVNVLCMNDPLDSPALAPWQFTTRHETLANAVSAEFKRKGVCPIRVFNVGVASAQINAVVDARLKRLFECDDEWKHYNEDTIVQAFGDNLFPESVSLLNTAPKPFIPGDYKDLKGPARYARMARHYGAMLARGAPPDDGPFHGPQSLVKEHQSLSNIQKLLMKRPVGVVKSAADVGDADSALDYGIRLSLGLDCEPSRKLSRLYLMKAVNSKTGSSRIKATAHGLLVFWHYDPSITETVPVHFVYAACYHADQASVFACRASLPNSPTSPAVIWLRNSVINFNNARDIPSDMRAMYETLFFLDKESELHIRDLGPWALKRRLDQPRKYMCAAVDCDIQVDFSAALSECAGKCDKDKKPSYCSWQCQKADWAAHKPFCRPGAKCSVVEDAFVQYAVYGNRTAPTFRIQIDSLEEDAPVLKSNTLTAAQLKALKPFSENPARFKFPIGFLRVHKNAVAGDLEVTAQMGDDIEAYDALASPQSAFSEESSFRSDSSPSCSSGENTEISIASSGYISPQHIGLNNEMGFYPMIAVLGLLSFFFSDGRR